MNETIPNNPIKHKLVLIEPNGKVIMPPFKA